jgi:E1A/CREB-binding protein
MIKSEESIGDNSVDLTTNSALTSVMIKSHIEWQRCITQEMRNYLIQKCINTLIPVADTDRIRDKRILNISNYARRVENEIFEMANNQEEYFQKLAEKIYKMRKELEDRREKKRLQDIQGQTSSTNDLNGKIHSNMNIQV